MQKTLLISIAVVLVGVVGAYFLFNQSKGTTTSSPTPQTTISNDQLLQEVAQKLEVKPEFQDSTYWNWIDANQKLLPLTGKNFLLGTVNINGIGKYGTISSDDLSKIDANFFKPIEETVTSYFLSKNFTNSASNARITPELKEHYVGFENGDQKCLLKLSEQTDPFGAVFCGTVDKDQMALQSQFSDLFSTSYNPTSFMSFRVQKVDGNFALGNTAQEIEGYTWMAKKTNGKWEIVWKGTEIALCSEMKKFEIPKSIYGDCYTP